MRPTMTTLKRPMFVVALGSLLTDMAAPVPIEVPEPSATSIGKPMRWREVDFMSIETETLQDLMSLNQQRLANNEQVLGLEAPEDFPVEMLSLREDALSGRNQLWDAKVVAYFEMGTTIFDITKTTLRSQLELLAVKRNLTAYDCLMSPIMVPAEAGWVPLVRELRTVVLPSLITLTAIDNALKRGVGIVLSECANLRAGKKEGSPESKNAKAMEVITEEKALLQRAKGFCFGVWCIMRAVLHIATLKGDDRTRSPCCDVALLPEGASGPMLEQQWRSTYTVEGLLAVLAESDPKLFDVSFEAIIKNSATVVGKGDGTQLLTASMLAAVASAVQPDSGEHSPFPTMQFIRRFIEVRKRRGVACEAILPPYTTDVLLTSIIKVIEANAQCLLRSYASSPSATIQPTDPTKEAVEAANSLMLRACRLASGI